MCQSDSQASSSMMMANSAFGAYGQYAAGKVNAQNAMTKANFEVAQLEAMGVIADARKFQGEADIRMSMSSQIQNNIAQAMLSGLDMSSFDSIDKGMRKDTTEALGKLDANTRMEKLNLRNKSAMAMLGGQMDAAAFRLRGNLGALKTLNDGFQTYQDTKHGDKMDRSVWREQKYNQAKSFLTSRNG